MQFIDRLKTGLVLTKDSLLLLAHNPKLAVFPLVSGVAALAFLSLFLGITFGLASVALDGVALVTLFLAYVVLTFISTFFVAGLVHETREVLAGNEASFRGGLEAAWGVKGPILVWSLVAATVGVIINAIENSDSRIARFFGMLFGVAWTLLTFFIVPVIVFEGKSGKAMFTESAKTFKDTWGETPVSLFAVQIIGAVIVIPLGVVGYLLFSVVPLAGVGVILAGFALAFLVGQTLQGIVKTTLYLYATTGERPAEFDNIDFDDLADEQAASPRSGGTMPRTGGFN